MGEHSISSIKKAAKRILGSYFFRCILASFITGTGILLIFNYILDGSMQVSNAFDTEAVYQSLMSASSVDELYSTIYNRISSLVQSVGYDTYSIMLRRFAIASIVSYLIRLMYNFLVYIHLRWVIAAFTWKDIIRSRNSAHLSLPLKKIISTQCLSSF